MPAVADQHVKGVIQNPFEEPVPHISEFTAIEIATLQSRLDKQLGPEFISTRAGPGGGRVHYLAAEKVINLANEVFGFNGWSSSIQRSEIDFVDVVEGTNKVSLGMSVVVRVTLRDGTFHEDMGYGHIENCKGKAPAFEKARKEAVTDALKRALRNFGKVLGNCLYDKEYLQKVTKIRVAPSRWNESNLHRHPDYAPIKKEAIADVNPPQTPAQSKDKKPESQHSEVEDDFGGGGLFDGVELANEDGAPALDSSDPHQPAPQGRPHGPQRNASMPAAAQQSPARPRDARMDPPAAPLSNARPQPPRMATAPGSSNCPPNLQQRPNLQPNPNSTLPNQAAASQVTPQPPQGPSGDIPPRFVTSRAIANNKDEPLSDGAIAALPKFNPEAESPSIKRTPGIDHSTSAAVGRAIVGQAPRPDPKKNPAPPSNGQPPQRQPQQPLPHQQNGAPQPPQQRPQAPTNFVNPAADPGRRVGMPVANRSPYRPPGGVKRPAPSEGRTPLADVSNAMAQPGTSVKGAKVEQNDVADANVKRPRVSM